MLTRNEKIMAAIIAILTTLTILGLCLINSESYANASGAENLKKYIGEERAKEIALSDAGVSAADATYIYAHLDRDDRVIDYDVDFYYNGNEYDYEINAYTGAILEKSVEKERIPDYADQQAAPSADAQASAATAPSADTQPSSGTYYDDDYYDDYYDDWDDRYDDYDDRYDDDWDDRYDDDRYDDDWDDRYDDDDDWDD